MFKGKLRKLIKNPKLFFSDMAENQTRRFGKVYTKKLDGHYQYTVVSAVYNVGRFLDDYFSGFINQKLSFKKHIHLILVDDGSTDNSAQIIKKWQRKYPDNITYLHQENAGQSCARNLGLQHVKTEWVTFIDPDDFLDISYFYNLDNFVYANADNNIRLLGCNIIFYFEAKKMFKDGHPLGYRFKKGNHLVALSEMVKEVQLSASPAFFKTEDIIYNNLQFDSRVKPNFEDGHFIAQYLLYQKNGSVAFLRDSKYYYRKREDGTSTLDTSWTRPERFLNVPEYGYLDTLRKYKSEKNTIPAYIQRTVLYEMVWYVKYLVNNAEKAALLNEEQKKKFISMLKEIFTYLDKDMIMNFDLAGAWFYHKVGMLKYFKNEEPDAQIVYIEKYDRFKDMVQLRYFTNPVGLEQISLDGKDTIPAYAKTVKHDLLDDVFILERRLWVPLDKAQKIEVSVSGNTRVSFAGKQYREGVDTAEIRKHFQNLIPTFETKIDYHQAWILMDRDTQADDNAEHLYRYIQKNHPEKKIYFVLQKSSHDWKRLAKDGFNLLEFGSKEHILALGSCSKVVSSHANRYVTNFLGPRMLMGKHFVFLQHGVIKDDLSGWLNSKEDIDCFITTSPDEYHSICDDMSRYYYSKKEVFMTGLPRHDKLVSEAKTEERLIIIMPTWRRSIVGQVVGEGETRELNPKFMETDFATHWFKVLHSPLLSKYAKKYNFKVAFFPHANIQPYLHLFKVPAYIEVITHSQGSIQNLFNRASLMITDYSSVAFEMAVQNKQTIYYQFDADECFQGGHIYSKGYYDYKKDGFGPVVMTEAELFKQLNIALKNNAVPPAKILQRIENTFPNRDGLCCERTFQAIESLDMPLPADFINDELYRQYALQASKTRAWPLAEQRWKAYLENAADYEQESEACVGLTEALRKQGKIAHAYEALNCLQEKYPGKKSAQLIASSALLNMSEHLWDEAVLKWHEAGMATLQNSKYCYCLYKTGDAAELQRLCKQATTGSEFSYACLYLLLAQQKWEEAICYLTEREIDFSSDEHLDNKLLLTLSYCYQQIHRYKQAHDCLAQYENYIDNDPQCRLKIARLARLRKNWDKIISQLNKARTDIMQLPQEHLYYYFTALIAKGKSVDAYKHYHNLPAAIKNNPQFISLYADACMGSEKWQEAIALFDSMQAKSDDIYYKQALAFRKMGRITQALTLLKNKVVKFHPDAWLLRCELAQIEEDWDEAYHCWLSLMRYSPEKLPENGAERLQNLRLLCGLAVN